MSDEAPTWPIQGVWNAYVVSGKDREERRARLGQCPESLRAGVVSHLKTVAAVREAARIRAVRAEFEAA